jgi:Putative auto-transporter adhesin, head GIN domain
MRTFLLAAALALASAAGAANAEKRDYSVSNISALSTSIPLDLEIVQDDRESLTLEHDENRLDEVEATMDDGTVRIRSKVRSTNWHKSVRGVLHVKRIESIHLAGTGSIRSQSIRADALKATISGSGKIQFRRLDAKEVKVAISGSGTIDLGSGRVEELDVIVTGAGDVVAGKLRADSGKVSITGAGTTTLWPERTLDVRITGAGNVRYFGDPQVVERRVAGIGSVKRAEGAPGS